MRDRLTCLALAVALGCFATNASAAVTISSAATTNMICSGGVCAPTATKAVLNVGDLETLLASGNVTVTTTGTGVQASDIDVKAALTWSSTGALSLLANKFIVVDEPVSITGLSGLTIQTGTSGAFSFGKKGNVTFANLSSQLTINGSAYTLVGDIKTLANDIAASPSGDFALAGSYNAGADGTYQFSPIGTVFTGTFEGLGNAISNLSIAKPTLVNGIWYEGLFAEIGLNGAIDNIGLVNASIAGAPKSYHHIFDAPLAGFNDGAVTSSYATGTVTVGKESLGGGLIGDNDGTILNSYAATNVIGIKTTHTYEGGLVGQNDEDGLIEDSYATGNVVAEDSYAGIGGLVAFNNGTIRDSYATGSAMGLDYSDVGGLVGSNYGLINGSYSMGSVEGISGFSYFGGLIGNDEAQAGSITDTYWDTDTSGQDQGAGNIANDPGITGLTTAQFQSGLPAGFDPKVWAEKSNIDDGFPYLLANKPVK
jgi:hypothetical protein